MSFPDHDLRAPAGPETSVSDLARRARDGDRGAFEELVHLFHGDVFRMAWYRTRSRMDAEDIAQDVFLRACSGIHGLKDAERFRAWLFSIAVNRVRDFVRASRFRALFGRGPARDVDEAEIADRPDESPGPADLAIRQEFWKDVGKLAELLSRSEREAFFLRFLDQLSVPEIAQVLDKSENTVKTLLLRAMRKVRANSSLLAGYREGGI